MTVLLYLILALPFIALLSIAWDLWAIYRLHVAKKHDWIIYRFCQVRDSIAELVLDGKLSEESCVFQFFYTTNANIIHHHKSAGLCFSNFLKEVDDSVEPSPDNHNIIEKLLQEIRKSDREVRDLIGTYDDALFDAIISSLHLIVVHKILRGPKLDGEITVRIIGKIRILPLWVRDIILFWSQIHDSGRSSHSTGSYA